MGIPESQLEIWSRRGSRVLAKKTAKTIRNILENYKGFPDGAKIKIYLQGSYGNKTNTRGNSDVDVVIELASVFRSNLNEEQKQRLGLIPASYSWASFKADVHEALVLAFGASNVETGNKSIKLASGDNRLAADIVPALHYRSYYRMESTAYNAGIAFFTTNEGREVINYPKLHKENGKDKYHRTNQNYKQVVRMFKNARKYLIESNKLDRANHPSYFVECLLFNVPDTYFNGSRQEIFSNILEYLQSADLSSFKCQNRQHDLFGMTPEQWNEEHAKELINALVDLWESW